MPEIRAVREAVRRLIRAVAVSLMTLVLVTCTDNPVGPGRGGVAYLRLQPVFNAWSRAAPLTLDGVRVVVVRPPSDTLADVSQPFSATSSSVRLNIPVRLEQSSEDLEVNLELYAGAILLFSGTSTVQVTAGTANTAAPIPVTYQGPGSNIGTITLDPRDTAIYLGTTLPMRVSAVDSQQAPVAQFYVSWSATGGTIDGAGLFTPPGARDTVFVKAFTPTGIADSTRVFIYAAPATLAKVSGDAQSAAIGARLPQPLVVRVNGTDGQPVPGVAVNFAATVGGGSVDSATATTDFQGLAHSGATLGLTVGPQTFTASAPGLGSVSFDMSATSGGLRTWTGAVSTDWNTAGNWNPAAPPTAADSVVIPTTSPNAANLTGNATIGALTIQGTGNNLTVAGNLTVQRGIALPDTNSFIDMTSGVLSAGSVTLSGYQAFIDAPTATVTVTGATTINGNRAFLSARGSGNSFGPVTISGSQPFFEHGGGSSGAVSVTGTGFWEGYGPVTITGNPAITVTGDASVSTFGGGAAPITVNGDMILGGTDGRLVPGPTTGGWTINGNLQTTANGRLVMTQNSDTVRVNGNASFGGQDETGSLTAGGLFVRGNFTQAGVATSFASTGTVVTLNGSGTQTVSFASPGFAASRFDGLLIENTAGQVQFAGDVYVSSLFGRSGSNPAVLSGNGGTLFLTNLILYNWTFNNVLVNVARTTGFIATPALSNVVFQGYAPTATPLTIADPGVAPSVQFTNVSFTVTPTTGFYLSATDNNPSDGLPLVVDMFNPSPLSNGGLVQLAGATVNWPAGVFPGTWTGAQNTDWNDGRNWSNGQVPNAAVDVTIPAAAPRFPVLTANGFTGNLTVQSGASVGLGTNTLQVGGDLDASGPISGSAGSKLVMANANSTLQAVAVLGTDLEVTAPVLLGSDMSIGGSLTVNGGAFSLNGHAMGVGGDFATKNDGLLYMLNPADALNVSGNATFDGGNQLGFMTTGVLTIGGNFAQFNTSSDDSFHPSGNHLTAFIGTSVVISFAKPGDIPGSSHFERLLWSGGGAMSLGSNVFAHGTFVVSGGPASITDLGLGFLLSTGGVSNATPLTFNGARLRVNLPAGGPLGLNDLTFQNMNPAATQLSVEHTGLGGPFALSNLVFSTTPTTGGFYLSALDLDGATNGALTLDVVNPSPATPDGPLGAGQFKQELGGAVINWPAASPVLSWNGSAGTDWFNGNNWTPVFPGGPTSTTDVTIPSGVPGPVIATNADANTLTIASGATLTVGGLLTVNGDLDASGAIIGAGTVRLAGRNRLVAGTTTKVEVHDTASYTASGAIVVSDTLTVRGRLDVGGQTITIPGALRVFANFGLLVMQQPTSYVFVGGNATFAGISSAGFLTDGLLEVQGSFSQGNAISDASFSASGNHLTSLTGGNFQQVDFQLPGAGITASHFEHLELGSKTGGGVSFTHANATVVVEGQLIAQPPSGFVQLFGSNNAQLAVGGVRVHDLVFNDLPLTIGSGVINQFDRVTFGGFQGDETQLTVDNPGLATPFVFDGLTFQDLLTTGHYLLANDRDGGAPALVIGLTNPSPANGSANAEFVEQNGAQVNWPATGGALSWTGAGTDWFDPANWSPSRVPTVLDDATIPVNAPLMPLLTASTGINSLAIEAGATVNVDTTVLVIGGTLDNLGTIDGVAGVGGLTLTGTGKTMRGTVNVDVVVPGSYALNGSFSALSVSVAGSSGSLDLNLNTLTTTNEFTTLNSGTVTMSDPADQLLVGGDAIFAGGDETGRLTAGYLQVGGDFSQVNLTSASSFVASGNHSTYLTGLNPTVTFTSPTASHFWNLGWGGIGGTLTLGSDVAVVNDYGAPDGQSAMAGNGHTFTSGSFFSNGLDVDNMPIVIDQPVTGSIGLFGITFANMATSATQITIRYPGQPNGVTFSSIVFDPLTTGDTGFYIDASDTDAGGSNPDVLSITVDHDPSPAGGPSRGAAFTKTAGGAVVNWLP